MRMHPSSPLLWHKFIGQPLSNRDLLTMHSKPRHPLVSRSVLVSTPTELGTYCWYLSREPIIGTYLWYQPQSGTHNWYLPLVPPFGTYLSLVPTSAQLGTYP